MTRPSPPILPSDGFNELAVCRHGLMIFNRNDQYIGASLRKYGEYCSGETELFRQLLRPGDTVVEAGANIGAHTVDLCRLVGAEGRVLAFEPQRIVFQTLCANLALNSCANAYAFQAGIGAATGEVVVPFLPPEQSLNFGGLSLLGATVGDKAPMQPIDGLGLEACNLIKLDIEGMEVEALKGGAQTIQKYRPLMYVENDRQDRSYELISILLSWNYRLYRHEPQLFAADNFAGDVENIFDNVASFNVLCLPREREIAVVGMSEIISAITD